VSGIRRREFVILLGGSAAVAWPLPVRAQQRERMRRIGVLLPAAPDDAEQQSWLGAFLQGLAQSGWITGRNIRIETRWTKFDPEETRKYAAELVALAPDVIVAVTSNVVAALQRETRSVPIVFVSVIDPVGHWLGHRPSAAGRQHYRFYYFRIRAQPEMAGAAQGDCTPRHPSGSFS